MRQRDLEIWLERVPPHPKPDPSLEQYRTPAPIAADMLYRALGMGDIQERKVLDLGCGTGTFALGAAKLGATSVTGVDIDPVPLEVAKELAAKEELEIEWLQHNAPELPDRRWDTCIMNPPFGAQYGGRGADTKFLEAATTHADVTYALLPLNAREHLDRVQRRLGWHSRTLTTYEFPIPHQFRFHTREKLLVPVALYRVTGMSSA